MADQHGDLRRSTLSGAVVLVSLGREKSLEQLITHWPLEPLLFKPQNSSKSVKILRLEPT